MAVIQGTAGDDVLHGTGLNDRFELADGGNDFAQGRGLSDTFIMGSSLTAADSLDGGNGGDAVYLDGDYAGLVLSDTTFVSIEALYLGRGHDYSISIDNATVDDHGGHFSLEAQHLRVGDNLVIDASRIDHGLVFLNAGAGDDLLTGGQTDNYFDLGKGGADTVLGAAHDDRFSFGAALGVGDSVAAGDGYDILDIDGAYAAAIVLDGQAINGVEAVQFEGNHAYHLVVEDGLLGAGQSLQVISTVGALHFDGSAESEGWFDVTGARGADNLVGGAGDDRLTGNKGGDTLQGGGGADYLVGGAGRDWFVYANAGDSTTSAADEIQFFTGADVIDLRLIDADSHAAGNQAFHRVDDFSHHAGELVVKYDADTNHTDVMGDVDGDGSADLLVQIIGDHSSFAGFRL